MPGNQGTNGSNDIASAATTPARRWWAALVGLAVFLVCIVVFNLLIGYLLGFGRPQTVGIGETPPLDPGFTSIALIGWVASGFVSAMIAGAVGGFIAPDSSSTTFKFNLTAGIVLLIGAAFLWSVAVAGFNLIVFLRTGAMLVGGIVGINKAIG